MSISVTVSGEDSTSVILAQALSDAVTISGSSAVEVTTTSGNSATITVSTGDPITITGNYSNYVTGDVVRPPEISDFLTENQINSKINTATGDYNTLATNSFYAKSNPSGYITGVDLSAYTTEEFVTGLSGSLQGQISSNDSEIAEIVNSTGSFALKSETGSFISESQTGQFYASSNPSGYITGVDLSALEAATGNLDTRVSSNSLDILSVSGLITSNDGDISELQAATGLLVQKSETGSFVLDSETGTFYSTSNPSGFITGVDLSSYVQNSETGLFLVSGQDAAVDALDVAGNAEFDGNLKIGSTPAYSPTRSIKLHDDGVQYGSRVSLIGTTDNGFPGLEMVTDGNLSKRTLIRHEGEGSNDYGISLYTTDASTVSESVRFAGNGNVGIGQTNPAAPLSVNGNVLVNTNNPDVDGTPLVVRGNTDFHGIAIKGPRSPRIYFDEGADGSETELAFFGIQDNDNAFVMRNWGGSSNDLLFAVQGGGGRAAAASSEALQLFHNGQITLNAAWADGVTDSQLYMHVPSASIKGITVDGAVGQTANLQEWKVNGTALSVINSDGNVGIGTDTPSGKLHIAGSAQNSYIEPIVENTAATGAAGFAFKNSNQEWKIGVNTADTFRVRDHNAGANIFQIEPGAPGNSLIVDSNGKTTAKQIEAVSSSYPVLGFTRETSTAGGSFDSVNGIASAMKLITKTSANMTDGFGGGIVFALSDNTFESNANARIYARRDGSDGNAALQFFNQGSNGTGSSMIIRSNGNVGIGTTTPSEKLEVSGNLMLQQNGVIKNNNNNTQFRFDPNAFYFDNGHIRGGYSVGVRGNKGNQKGMDQGSTTSDLGLYCGSNEAISIRNDGNVDANYNFTINQDLSVSGESLFSSRPTVNGTGVLLSGEGGGGGTVANVVHTTGDQTISGTKSFGKISLSENSFVTETGSFTMGSTHRGATVLLQNSAPMTVTIPAQVSGHTTTFIAETSNSVVFATGAGISGFNSFNSANQIAGIYGQAQIIFKSPEYAFLGGNVV
jgi:hypothetical protein